MIRLRKRIFTFIYITKALLSIYAVAGAFYFTGIPKLPKSKSIFYIPHNEHSGDDPQVKLDR